MAIKGGNLMKLAKNLFIILIINIIFINPSWAITKAWLIGSEKALKLNVEVNAIEKEVAVPVDEHGVFLDTRRGNLFTLYSPARFIEKIAVYDVKTFKLKGELDINISSEITDEVQLLFPPSGNLFYLRWVKKEDGPPEIITYDATTFKPVNRYTTTPATTDKLMLSAAGDLLYSIWQGTLKIDIFQTNDFSYKSSINIKNFFTIGTEGGVSKYDKEKLLVSEVISRTPELDYYEYIYDIPTNKITQKIRTTIKGRDFLIPLTNRIALHERQYIGKFKSMRLSTDYISLGKIHIFDATTGQKVGFFQIPVGSNTIGDIIGVSPLEDKLYVRTYNASGDKSPKLYIINLKTNTIANEIPLPETSMKMIFFEE
jgi:hypothetical protein